MQSVLPGNRGRGTRAALKAAAAVLLTAAAQAQTVPDAGQILRENQPQPRITPPNGVPTAPTTPVIPRPANETPFTVKHFRLTGVTLIPETEIQAVLAPYLGHEITFTDLRKALAAISQLYERHGWLARAQLPEQDIVNGEVTINILEGRLGAIQLRKSGTPRISDERVTATMMARQQAGQPLSLSAMDRAINVLNDTPGAAVAATLAPGESTSASDIIVTLQEKPLVSGSATADNAGPRSTSPWRLNGNVNFDSPGGFGDQATVNLVGSLGMQFGRLGYTLPVGYDGWRLGVNVSALRYKLRHSFSTLDAQGDALTVGATASYPLLRSSTDNINLGVSFDYKHFGNSANGLDVSRKSVYVGTVTLGGDTSDRFGGGGLILWNADLAVGGLDLSANAQNEAADASGPRSAGTYARLTANIARLQRLSEQDTLWLSVFAQQAFKNLDSSEKFWIGGPQAVRAYPVSEGSGDSGWLSTIEYRHSFSPNWQASAFYDHGSIMVNHNNDYNTLDPTPNHYGLDGIGLGLAFLIPGKLAIHATVAHGLGGNPGANPLTGKDSDGTRDKVRAWVNASVFF